MKKIGKRSLESLSCSGAFDELVDSREKCFSSIDKIVSYSESIFVPSILTILPFKIKLPDMSKSADDDIGD